MPDDVKEDPEEIEDPDAPVVVNTDAVTINTARPDDHPDDEGDEGEDAETTTRLVPYDQETDA